MFLGAFAKLPEVTVQLCHVCCHLKAVFWEQIERVETQGKCIRFGYRKFGKPVKSQFHHELSVPLWRTCSCTGTYQKSNVYFAQMGIFWSFFILTSLVGKLLNRGRLVRVLLHFIPFTECEGQMDTNAGFILKVPCRNLVPESVYPG